MAGIKTMEKLRTDIANKIGELNEMAVESEEAYNAMHDIIVMCEEFIDTKDEMELKKISRDDDDGGDYGTT